MKEEDFKKKLTDLEYKVLREKGTEAPFQGKYVNTTDSGTYMCKACGAELFNSETKFDTDIPGLMGWPSFDQAIPGAVEFAEDRSGGMLRTEVICAKCKSHLGHIFDDRKASTGKHYCVNSCALDLKRDEE